MACSVSASHESSMNLRNQFQKDPLGQVREARKRNNCLDAWLAGRRARRRFSTVWGLYASHHDSMKSSDSKVKFAICNKRCWCRRYGWELYDWNEVEDFGNARLLRRVDWIGTRVEVPSKTSRNFHPFEIRNLFKTWILLFQNYNGSNWQTTRKLRISQFWRCWCPEVHLAEGIAMLADICNVESYHFPIIVSDSIFHIIRVGGVHSIPFRSFSALISSSFCSLLALISLTRSHPESTAEIRGSMLWCSE